MVRCIKEGAYDIEKTTLDRIDSIIATREPLGKFYAKDNDIFVAVDNSSGDAWTEEFKSESNAVKWLEDTSLRPEDLEEGKTQILNEDNAVKVKLSQSLEYNVENEDDEYVDEDRIIQDIEFDESSIADDLLEYLKDYSYQDEYKEIYNSVNKVTIDIDDSVTVYLELGKDFDDESIRDAFQDFIKEIVLQDDQFSGFGTYTEFADHDEDVEDEYGNYVRTVDVVDDEWEVEYTYTINVTGEQEIEINR